MYMYIKVGMTYIHSKWSAENAVINCRALLAASELVIATGDELH